MLECLCIWITECSGTGTMSLAFLFSHWESRACEAHSKAAAETAIAKIMLCGLIRSNALLCMRL